MTLSYIPSDTNDEGILKATASGVLPNGKPVIVNADGTVSVISGSPEGGGTPVAFNSAYTLWTASAYDSNSNKVVIAYRDGGNSNYGTAVVGTVSGSTISFGSEVVFQSANCTYIAATFDSNSNKVVLAYQNDGNAGRTTAIVGTVSGTGISFGTAVQVASTSYANWISATFDSNSNKVVIAVGTGYCYVGTVSGTGISFGSGVYYSAANSYVAITFDSNLNKVVFAASVSNICKSRVGTVSGTSISVGTEFNGPYGTNVNGTFNSICFDSNSNKVVLVSSVGTYGKAVVGTVSGTSISYGTPVSWATRYAEDTAIAFDSNANKVVSFYRDYGNSYSCTSSVGTVSGTTISFEAPIVINQGETSDPSAIFNSSTNNVVVAFGGPVGGSAAGAASVYNFNTLNLTAENYIGISTGGTYASGSNATIKIIGNTSNEQSSLTAGQAYYVQTDGTIGTTAANPSVFAGTAISATRLIVKT